MGDMRSGRHSSYLGEHLVVFVVVAMMVIASALTIPSFVERANGIATQTQERVNAPLDAAAALEQTP
jgi:hypothetical protein